MPRKLQISMSELLDRYTIETRKAFYGHGNDALLADVRYEILGRIGMLLTGSPEEVVLKFGEILMAAAALGIHNSDIANLEWQLRARNDFSLEEHGRRARMIRKINDDGRVAVKQQLSKWLHENIETRHYGYGDLLRAEDLTLDVQEPRESKHSYRECNCVNCGKVIYYSPADTVFVHRDGLSYFCDAEARTGTTARPPEPAEMGKTISEVIGTASHPARVSSDVVDFTKSEFYR